MAGIEFSSVFYEISVLVLLAAVLGLIGLALRQPLVVAFIAAGILAGPGVLGLVHSEEFIGLLSQISIAVLLFLVGLKLDVNLVRNLGKVAVATGLGQVTFTAWRWQQGWGRSPLPQPSVSFCASSWALTG